MLSETHSIIVLDLFDQLENQKARTNNAEEQLKIRRRVFFDSSFGRGFEAWDEMWTTSSSF
ncbi:hypothetical protein KY290_030735 [Solanum tuberosum]|uniref:Uncharacterized protein n=1 Tax=Solanum tuberosum TaxID=4113 RepID=A0ABQ7U902_SOLTU|nr:hypothetical protein KY289_029976 [Solanum tuberosum]KAH0742742.1 hypothetical protein KY290_030735 [Solanum tuberosum]